MNLLHNSSINESDSLSLLINCYEAKKTNSDKYRIGQLEHPQQQHDFVVKDCLTFTRELNHPEV